MIVMMVMDRLVQSRQNISVQHFTVMRMERILLFVLYVRMQALILSQNVQVLVRENMKNMYVMAAILKLKSAIISVHSLMKLNM